MEYGRAICAYIAGKGARPNKSAAINPVARSNKYRPSWYTSRTRGNTKYHRNPTRPLNTYAKKLKPNVEHIVVQRRVDQVRRHNCVHLLPGATRSVDGERFVNNNADAQPQNSR